MGKEPEVEEDYRYGPELKEFWAESFEAELVRYLRNSLTPLIDAHFAVDPTTITSTTTCLVEFTLKHTGELVAWRVKGSSGIGEFDQICTDVFLAASKEFPPMPEGASDAMPLSVKFSEWGPWCDCMLLWRTGEMDDFMREVEKVLRNMVHKTKIRSLKGRDLLYGLVLQRGYAEMRLCSQTKNQLEPGFRGRCEIALSDLKIPDHFPEEIRLGADLSGFVWAYGSGPRQPRPNSFTKRWSERTIAASQAREAKKLKEFEAKILERPDDLDLILAAAHCADEAGQIDRSIELARQAISIKPKSCSGYAALAEYLWKKSEDARSPAKYWEEVIKYRQLALEQTDLCETTKRNSLMRLVAVFARTGRYREAVETYVKTYDDDEIHNIAAKYLKEAGDWENALREYRMADRLARKRRDYREGASEHFAEKIQECLDHVQSR